MMCATYVILNFLREARSPQQRPAPRSPQLEKARVQQRRPNADKNKQVN